MNLLIITQYFYPENFRINDLVLGLTKRGHRVTVLTGQPNYPEGKFRQGYGWFGPREEKIFDANIVRVPLIARENGKALRLIFNYFSFVFFACLAVIFRLKGSFDAIFVFQTSPVTVGIPAILAKKKFKAPIYFWVLDLWPDSLQAVNAIKSDLILSQVNKMVSWIYGHCHRVLISSKSFLENVVSHGKAANEIHYFPNWVESEYLTYSKEKVLKSSENQAFCIVYAGNIGVAQDFLNIIKVIEKISTWQPGVTWKFAGNGRLFNDVYQEIKNKELSNKVSFLGQLPSKEAMDLLRSADALLVSLKSDPVFDKTVPGKVQSYLAAGNPILAMLNGEGAQIIEEANAGFVAKAGDSEGCVQNIVRLISLSLEEREQLGQNGFNYACKHFEREHLFNQLESWMCEAKKYHQDTGCS